MLKILHILSFAAKLIFYGMMAYFLVLVAGILSGSYRFAETDTAFYYMVLSSGMAAVSLLLTDLHGFLAKRKSRSETRAEGPDHQDNEGTDKMSE